MPNLVQAITRWRDVQRSKSVADAMTAASGLVDGDTVTGPSGTTYSVVDERRVYPHALPLGLDLRTTTTHLVTDGGEVLSLWRGHPTGVQWRKAGAATRLRFLGDADAVVDELAARVEERRGVIAEAEAVLDDAVESQRALVRAKVPDGKVALPSSAAVLRNIQVRHDLVRGRDPVGQVHAALDL